MTEQQHTETPDYEKHAVERKRNFVARSAAAVTGAVSGIVLGRHLVKDALRKYINDRLYTRDWTKGRLEETTDIIKNGAADTISAAPTSREHLTKWAEDYVAGRTEEMPGTLIGNKATFSAFRDFLNEEPAFVKKLIADFRKVESKLAKTRDDRIKVAESDSRVFPEKLASVIEKETANFMHQTNLAKKELFDTPIFDELMKPERMGLRLRHAHNKEQILIFSAGAAVAVGVVVHKGIKAILERNEHRKTDASFQANITAQRDAEGKNGPSLSPA